MKEKFNAMSKFKKGFAIYVGMLLLVMLLIWFAAWNYAAAYELAQPKGAMNAYVEETLKPELAERLESYSTEQANDYQSAEQIKAVMTEKLLNQDWTFRKSKAYTSDAPVYTLYCGETAMGTATLRQGKAGLLDFGLIPWEVQPVEAELDRMEKTVTVVAPVGCKVTLNGAPVTTAAETAEFYPDFAAYAETIKQPMELQVYRVGELCVDEIVIDCGDYRLVEGEEPNTYYAVAEPDEQTVTALETLAPRFAEAYLKYTSNAGTYYNVTQFVAPGSELLARLYKSRDGMSWVHYTTGKIMKCEVGEIEYFGNAATYDVEYVLNLKSGEMAGNMHVVCVHADYGWRVTDIELF